jgi:hypothetical protein
MKENKNNRFVWGEIKLPSPFYIPGTSFAEAWSINPQGGAIVGTFGLRPPDPANQPPPFTGNFHGFFKAASRAPGGQLDEFPDVELFGSYDFSSYPGGATSARGINDDRDVVGFYRDEKRGREIHGYVWQMGEPRPRNFDFSPTRLEQDFPDADGKVPPITDPKVLHNGVLGINNEKLVVGVYRPKGFNQDVGLIAHIGDPDVFVSVDMGTPDALDLREVYRRLGLDSTINTTVRAINSEREIVGTYTDISGTHGYKWKMDMQHVFDGSRFFDGRPTSIDISPFPLGPRLFFGHSTTVHGINDLGVIVGSYSLDGMIDHGFVWRPEEDGTYAPGAHVTIDIVGATNTAVSSISNNGVFVGYYGGMNIGGRHAFAGYLL